MMVKNKKVELVRSLIGGIICLIIGFWFWQSFAGNPFDEYALIRSGVISKGHIVKVEEYEENVEEGNHERIVPMYGFEYRFLTNDGKETKGYESGIGGQIPDSLKNVAEEPYPIQVEYLSKHPEVNRVIGMHTGCTSVGEWMLRKVALGGIMLLMSLSIGLVLIRNAVKEYNKKEQNV